MENLPNLQLRNPVNDVRSIASELQKPGFDVKLRLDANQQQMETASAGSNRLKQGHRLPTPLYKSKLWIFNIPVYGIRRRKNIGIQIQTDYFGRFQVDRDTGRFFEQLS